MMKNRARKTRELKYKRMKCDKCNEYMRAIYIRQHYYEGKQKKVKLIKVGYLCLGCKNMFMVI